jgi:hypothetical protein
MKQLKEKHKHKKKTHKVIPQNTKFAASNLELLHACRRFEQSWIYSKLALKHGKEDLSH